MPSWDDVRDFLDGTVDFAGTFTLGGGETETTVSIGQQPGLSFEVISLGLSAILGLILLAIILSE